MTDTHMLHTAPAPNKCPVAHHDKQAAAAHGPGYGLMRVSQVERDYPSHTALASVLDWMRGFLARSHPELGRKGVRSARVVPERRDTSAFVLRLPQADAALRAQVLALGPALAGRDLRACD